MISFQDLLLGYLYHEYFRFSGLLKDSRCCKETLFSVYTETLDSFFILRCKLLFIKKTKITNITSKPFVMPLNASHSSMTFSTFQLQPNIKCYGSHKQFYDSLLMFGKPINARCDVIGYYLFLSLLQRKVDLFQLTRFLRNLDLKNEIY